MTRSARATASKLITSSVATTAARAATLAEKMTPAGRAITVAGGCVTGRHRVRWR